MQKTRIRFYGLNTRQLDDESADGLCEYMNNMRPLGQEEEPYWVPFRDFDPETLDNTIPTIPTVECEANTESGGSGITEIEIALESGGGFICIDVEAFSVVDKFEIIHNGTKVATSGMTVDNGGPFDSSDLSSADQFIGTSKGSIPTRDSDFASEVGTPNQITITAQKDQLVWWAYDASDYTTAQSVIVRVTGPGGTAWNFTRRCESEGT